MSEEKVSITYDQIKAVFDKLNTEEYKQRTIDLMTKNYVTFHGRNAFLIYISRMRRKRIMMIKHGKIRICRN